MQAIIYTRESSQATLPTDLKHSNQEDDCRAWAREHGYSVYKVFRESHSGADLLNRPLIWEVIDEVKSGHADTVLVRNYDRLARKPEHQAVILYEVEEKSKGHVISVLEPIDSEDIASRTTRAILAVVAEAERLNSRARMVRGMRKRAERGDLLVAGSPLFGFNWLDDEPGKRTTYIPDPVSAPIVQRIFSLVVAGMSLYKISDLFNAESVPTPSQVNQMRGHGGRRPVAPVWKPTLLSR